MAEKTVRIYGAIKPPKKLTKKEFEKLQKKATNSNSNSKKKK